MAADFKSHILSRDEKGFAGVPFKRLLLGAVIGGLAYTVCRLGWSDGAIPLGIAVALITVVLTGTRGGLPLWLRGWLSLRGRLVVAGSQRPDSLTAEIARLVKAPVALARLDAAQVFTSDKLGEIDLCEWITFARPQEADRGDGLRFLDSPLAGEER